MRRAAWMLLTLAFALYGTAVARAIELQVVDQQSDTQTSPAQAPLAGCTTDADGALIPRISSTSVSLQARTNTLVTGSQCNAVSVQSTNSGSLTVSIIGAPGATGELCYATSFEAATTASGSAATSTQDIGGSPYATAGGVFLNGNPVSTVLRHFDSNQGDGATARGLVTVTVGDTVRLATGTNSQSMLDGAGRAESQGKIFTAIYVGECPRERAPVASPLGLAALAAALATLGTLTAVRRRRTKDAG